MAKTELKTASVLAFERVLDISDASFWQKDSQNADSQASIVTVQEKSVRGTISNRLKNAVANDPAKLDAETQKANLQRVDSSSLDESNDTLIAKFTCKVLPFTGKPNVCNDQDYQQALLAVVADYQQSQGVSELAKRYATNIVNARWLWRNRVGAEKITVTVRFNQQTLTFNAKDFALNAFNADDKNLAQLAQWIEQGLTGQAFVILSIEAQAHVGYGQEVYPSQELILDTGSKKSKVLYRVGDITKNHAGMHSQKVSNAIRTIDTWYPEYEDNHFPIAIEPYGAVTTLGKAFRQPKQGKDFYNLFDKWVLKGEKPEVSQQHYVMGVLIRGGVFGESGKE
ncbi:type I-F CRISPR-associated protein Csy3 [Moraxella osloensis]|jgi:CRISPR-associated protein Csy3|nr:MULTISPECIES: type I-F CRISPR-associated protein Csy3 [Moraxella]ATQ85941.1 type I-F CRISPR-associated protein Csy3 [Moraxella osloensis]MBW4018351.1 type I-F CRISPR-associated protein Csy3 [Moraxella osloensis]PAL13804.1 type I-F CRISPR-associated protein Csy3 [Moraxella osloensis]